MTNEIAIIFTLSLIVFISPFLSKKLNIPVVPIEMLLGSLAVTIGLIEDNKIFTLVAELGFLYLMFLAGLEVDLKELVKINKRTLKLGLLYVGFLYLLSTLVTLYFDLSKLFIIAMPLISIGLLAALKKEYPTKLWVSLSITIGLIGEIVSIVVLTGVSAVLEFGVGIDLYYTLAILFAVFVLIALIYKFTIHLLWWYPEVKNYLMPKNDHFEQDIRISMMIFFIMIAVMLYLHLEVALGAFIAGTFVRSFFHHKKELPAKLEQFGFGWIVPIFFIWVGTTFDLFSIFIDGLFITSMFIVIAMFVIRILSSLVFIYDYGFKNSILIGLSHSMPLTLLIAVATLAHQSNAISDFYYLAFVFAAILEVLFGMLIIKVMNRN
jgi:Kef-type K+ transport system membrane component KefB